MRKITLVIVLLLLVTLGAVAQISIVESGGWLESAYVKWTAYPDATSYNVYYSGMGADNLRIDNQLIRSYDSCFRADVLGLAPGTYTLKVVPVIGGKENLSAAAITPDLSVKPNRREGFAFSNNVIPGAYNMDGTPKTGAIII